MTTLLSASRNALSMFGVWRPCPPLLLLLLALALRRRRAVADAVGCCVFPPARP